MSKVYLLQAGHYSARYTVGVFSSREKAEAFKAAYPSNSYMDEYQDIEEYELDRCATMLEKGLIRFEVNMYRNGDIRRITTDPDFSDRAEAEEITTKGFVFEGSMEFKVWARDDKHAIKICNDRRAQMIANGEW